MLNDRRITIYGGGANDIAANKIDVRVLVLLEYIAEAHGQVTVSSLASGHRYYSRPGTVSAHVYGLAVDIAVLDNQAIYGHQQVGGITEKAVRNILRAAGRDQPATGHLLARPGRSVVPARRPRRPHPRRVLDAGSPRASEREGAV